MPGNVPWSQWPANSRCCSTGCGCGGCGCRSRYSVTTLVGARYMRIDDDFMFRTDYENLTTPGTGFLAYNAQADNHLVGFQLGCNGVYHFGRCCRWGLHCNSTAGVFGNHMEVSQFMDAPTGGVVRYANGTNANFNVEVEDDDVAFVGEIRAGLSYQYSCHCRIFGGYRALGISGLALGFDQVPGFFGTPNQLDYVASRGSIFLHGVQAGLECAY